ncbi:hydroxypyruvate isomerase family protein [Roseivirga sp. BDSF3-8]|uniref:hydroxypyruvate isomerase family protein n=1 Tax=Roseivirga sp. BDSF3-8 TaxID=3241598 RepID=UPI003531A5B3
MKGESRRTSLKKLAAGGAALALMPAWGVEALAETSQSYVTSAPTPYRHSVCRWTFGSMSLNRLCKEVKSMGAQAIDLVGPDDWDTLKKHGLDSSMCNGAELNLTDGWADTTHHADLVKNYRDMIPRVAEAGYRNLICFSGNRRSLSEEEGLQNCVRGLGEVLPLAEQYGVVLHMELLNSKVDHPDYMADHTAWGVDLCRRLDSEHFKLLYDIYHMQIMEGDVIRTLRDSQLHIGHYHTAGVPGRNEPDEGQELYYPAIMKAIADTGFKGYVAQEFIPKEKNNLVSLKKAFATCGLG